MSQLRGAQTNWRTFRTPLWIGVLSIVGLIAALVGDGIYDAVSWLGLTVPLITIYVSLRRPKDA